MEIATKTMTAWELAVIQRITQALKDIVNAAGNDQPYSREELEKSFADDYAAGYELLAKYGVSEGDGNPTEVQEVRPRTTLERRYDAANGGRPAPEVDPPAPYILRSSQGVGHGGFPTLDEARGAATFDRLNGFEIWHKGTPVVVVETQRYLSPAPGVIDPLDNIPTAAASAIRRMRQNDTRFPSINLATGCGEKPEPTAEERTQAYAHRADVIERGA
jgi:hypothetical protein